MKIQDEKILALVGNITIAIPDSRVLRILSSDDADDLTSAGVLSAVAAIEDGISYPLFDARKAVGLSERKFTQSREILVVGDKARPKIGIIVDSVLCTIVCDPSMHSSADFIKLPAYPLISNACVYRSRMVLLLDIDAIIAINTVPLNIADYLRMEAS